MTTKICHLVLSAQPDQMEQQISWKQSLCLLQVSLFRESSGLLEQAWKCCKRINQHIIASTTSPILQCEGSRARCRDFFWTRQGVTLQQKVNTVEWHRPTHGCLVSSFGWLASCNRTGGRLGKDSHEWYPGLWAVQLQCSIASPAWLLSTKCCSNQTSVDSNSQPKLRGCLVYEASRF